MKDLLPVWWHFSLPLLPVQVLWRAPPPRPLPAPVVALLSCRIKMKRRLKVRENGWQRKNTVTLHGSTMQSAVLWQAPSPLPAPSVALLRCNGMLPFKLFCSAIVGVKGGSHTSLTDDTLFYWKKWKCQWVLNCVNWPRQKTPTVKIDLWSSQRHVVVHTTYLSTLYVPYVDNKHRHRIITWTRTT